MGNLLACCTNSNRLTDEIFIEDKKGIKAKI